MRRPSAVHQIEDGLGRGLADAFAGFEAGRGLVGRKQQVWRAVQRMMRRQGLLGEDIERGARDPAFVQGAEQRGFVEERAARGVDEPGGGFHTAQLGLADQPVVLGRERGVQGEEIALGQEFVEGNELDAGIGFGGFERGVVRDDAEVEAAGALGHGATDASKAQDAEGFAREVVPPMRKPQALAHGEMAFDDAARKGEQQGEGVVGHGVIGKTGRVGDDDAARGGGGDVNGIIADTPTGNDFEAGGGGRLEDGGGVLVGSGERGVGAIEEIKQGLAAEAEARFENGLATGFSQQRERVPAGFFHRQGCDEHFPGHGASLAVKDERARVFP